MDGPRPYRIQRRHSCGFWAMLALALASAGSLCAQAPPAQTPPAPPQPQSSQQAFQIQHIDLAQAADRVRAMFGPNSGAVVFSDQASARLLVQASPQQLAAVGQLLAQLDQAPAPAAQPGNTNYMGAYAIPPEQRAEAKRWSAKFAPPEGSRVVFDERTGQLLVMGPARLHQFVQAEVRGTPAAEPTQNPNGMRFLPKPADPAATPQVPIAEGHVAKGHVAEGQASRLVLEHTTGTALHRRLEQLLSRPLPVTTDNGSEWLSFRAGLTPKVGVTIQAHRKTGEVRLSGDPRQVIGWNRVLQAIDVPATADDSVTQFVSTQPSTDQQIRRTLRVLQSQPGKPGDRRTKGQLVTKLFQPQPAAAAAEQPATDAPNGEEAEGPAEGDAADEETEEDGSLLGPVQIEFIEGLDIIVIRGNKRDVARVQEIINQIERVSQETVPAIEVLPLQHVGSESMARLLVQVYSEVLGPRTGNVSITALGKPNALLLIGRPENVKTAIELVNRLDVPVEPTTRFEVYPLRYAIAGDVKQLIDAFLSDRETSDDNPLGALVPKALVVADFRTNSLFVNAGPRDLAEIGALVKRIDVDRAAAIDEVRIFPLNNTVATDLAEVLQNAVLAGGESGNQEGGDAASARVAALRFITIDPENRRQIESGILSNIRIAADAQANSLIVTAPTESMELIAALIDQLDRAPNAEAEIKVFTIVNGDAVSLMGMLQSLFGGAEAASGGPGFFAGENALVRLQFSVDERTNSIIAAGSVDDLAVVYAILLKLDASDVRERKTEVYRLNNSPAEDVAVAINLMLTSEREIEAAANLALGPFEQMDREVVIVPEIISNSLIVSATPQQFEKITKLVDQLDERPPMVMIQLLIAEVRLNDTDEFGIELGLQDSLLFDRSVLDTANFTTITETVNDQSPGGATVSTTSETIVNSPVIPGFNFNNQPLGNNASTSALAAAGNVAAQGLSNFSLGRVNSELGFGGFVFSASSHSVSMLLRALQENRRLEVLSRPQVMALDNQIASITVGQRVPRIQSTTTTQFGQQNSIIYEDVGIILTVRPRISPDGMVVMEVHAEKSEVGSEQEGIPVFSGLDGTVVRAPRIDQTVADTTVAAMSGQTVVLSGLLTKRSFDIHRRVPLLADIPLLGDLFRFDSVSEQRTELLIVLTPRIVRNELDAEMIKQVESSRMSWVLCDAVDLHGPSGLRSRNDEWTGADAPSIYPTEVPTEIEYGPLPPMEGPPMQGPVMEGESIMQNDQAVSENEGENLVTPTAYQSTSAPNAPTPMRLPPVVGR